jgi:hypothetical protein
MKTGEVASQFKPWLLIDNAYVPAKDQVVE